MKLKNDEHMKESPITFLIISQTLFSFSSSFIAIGLIKKLAVN